MLRNACGDPTYGRSKLYALRGGLDVAVRPEPIVDDRIAESCGRLEGLAEFDGDLLLAYEGAQPLFKRLPLPP